MDELPVGVVTDEGVGQGGLACPRAPIDEDNRLPVSWRFGEDTFLQEIRAVGGNEHPTSLVLLGQGKQRWGGQPTNKVRAEESTQVA